MNEDQENQEDIEEGDISQEGEAGEVQSGEGEQSNQSSDDPIQLLESLPIDQSVKDVLKAGFLRQADYTQKTQAIATDRKMIDEYKEIKPYIDKVLTDPQLYQAVFGEGGEATGATPNANVPYPEDPIEYAQWVKDQTLQAIQVEADIHQAENLDPRLNGDQDFALTIAGLCAQDADFIAGKKSAVDATREAIQRFDTYMDKQKNGWRTEMNKKVQTRRTLIPNTGSPAATGGGKVPSTMREAMELAETQIGK